MIKKERQDQIIRILAERKYCTVQYLSRQLYVAPITVRRDLQELEASGLVQRCYGGATEANHENREIPFEVRSRSNPSAKALLARRAAELISNGDVVFLDASSTVSHIADFLRPEQNLTVVTNSMLVAEKLKEKRIHCYLTGGMPVENSYALVGSIAAQTLAGLYANICFFSSQGITADGVITDYSEAETALRLQMLHHAKKRYFVFDSSKYGKQFAFRVCDCAQLDGVITDCKEFEGK